MPSLQTVNFGPNPLNESLKNIASGFIEKYNQNESKKKNDEIFNRILSKYPKDTDPTLIYRDMLTAQGLDEDYKKNRITELKDYASLASKKDKTPYQEAILDQRKKDYDLKVDKDNRQKAADIINAQAKEVTNKESHLKYIKNYTKKERESLNEYENADFMRMISQSEDDAKASGEVFDIDIAVAETLEAIQNKKKIIADTVPTLKPTPEWQGIKGYGQPQWEIPAQALSEAKTKLFNDLNKLYNSGITRQSDLTKIAERGKWDKEEIQKVIMQVLQYNGKKAKNSTNELTEQQKAEAIF
jgi:hypothetical protein